MRVTVLVIRIFGIVLLVWGISTLWGVHAAARVFATPHFTPGTVPSAANVPPIVEIPEEMVHFALVEGSIAVLVGSILTLSSARVCRWLTFDYREKT